MMNIKEKKITKRELYEKAAKFVRTGLCDIDPEELAKFFEAEIALLDKKSERAKANAAKKAAEVDPIYEAVKEALTEEFTSIPDITVKVCEVEGEATVSKVQYRLNKLVNEGFAQSKQITVATENSKARKVMGFALA